MSYASATSVSWATAGAPILSGSVLSGSPQLRQYLESIGLFGGLGLLILFLGALAIGRFSMLAAKDVEAYDAADGYYPATTASQPDLSQYPAADQFQTSPDVYKSASGSFPVPGQAAASPPFPDAPSPFQDTTTGQYPPPQTS